MGTPGEHCFCGDYLGGACDGCRWERADAAPKDGTEIELLIRHHNYTYCGNNDDRNKWQEAVRGKWIDHNGGGWTWMGICGHVMAWRPLSEMEESGMILKHDYARAMELARARVADLTRQVEVAENHLKQLKETVAMDRRHLREAADSLAEMESVYAKWQDLTANVRNERPEASAACAGSRSIEVLGSGGNHET